MIQLVREDAMAPPVPREKIDLSSMHLAADECVRRFAKWRFDALLGRILYAFHLIKAASADDANGWCISIHFQEKMGASFQPEARSRQATRLCCLDFVRP